MYVHHNVTSFYRQLCRCDSDLPDGWIGKQTNAWKMHNNWLDVRGGKLGCFAYREAKSLLLVE